MVPLKCLLSCVTLVPVVLRRVLTMAGVRCRPDVVVVVSLRVRVCNLGSVPGVWAEVLSVVVVVCRVFLMLFRVSCVVLDRRR